MRGYTGANRLFHGDDACALLRGRITSLPEPTALKWGLAYCPDCTEQGANHAESQ